MALVQSQWASVTKVDGAYAREGDNLFTLNQPPARFAGSGKISTLTTP